jgi:hypothetical protein
METPYRVPRAAQYVCALNEITIGEAQRKMLEFHFKAHNRTVTFTELATAAGYDSYGAANLHYGKLGAALGERLGMTFVPLDFDDPTTPFYSSAIGTGHQHKGVEIMLIMHHELAKALETLGWFK